jgi:hypothetical protein
VDATILRIFAEDISDHEADVFDAVGGGDAKCALRKRRPGEVGWHGPCATHKVIRSTNDSGDTYIFLFWVDNK